MKANISGIGRKILTVDSALQTIFEFDADGSVMLKLPTDGSAFDVWRVCGNYLYCHLGGKNGHGVTLVSPENRVLMNYFTRSEIFTCQPIENGRVLVGELTEKRLVELTPDGQIDVVIPIQSSAVSHETMRMARKQPDGTYWVVQPGDRLICCYDNTGRMLWSLNTRADTFAAIPFGEHIIYTSKTAIVEMDLNGQEVWFAEADDLAQISPKWLTGMELAQNGNLLVCNWLGHGCEGQGIPLFEINRKKNIVWSLQVNDFSANLANLKEI